MGAREEQQQQQQQQQQWDGGAASKRCLREERSESARVGGAGAGDAARAQRYVFACIFAVYAYIFAYWLEQVTPQELTDMANPMDPRFASPFAA